MVVQNEAIKAAQKTFLDAVETTRTLEDKATLAARSEADAAIGKARAPAYDDASRRRRRRPTARRSISPVVGPGIHPEAVSIWNGELPEDLPPASTLESSAETVTIPRRFRA